MHLTIDEMLAYTDEERAKWESWFSERGSDALKIAVPMDAHPTVGALLLHCFWAELFYALWMRGDMLTEERVTRENEALQDGGSDTIFAFGRKARGAMREFTNAATEEDWSRDHEVEGRGLRIAGPARKLITHILIHEIRHFAQIALAVRQNGLTPPGDHDLLFSESFGSLIKKL